VETIEKINLELRDLNQRGIMHLEDEKCNFDVEIGMDMLSDKNNTKINNFIL
jgi:hypothetical protein